uniref:Beta-1,4-N-acetylgalactosaminyltransferase n=1 Tax=Sinocyclocheilus rhinocerous TaxID=307959 RepID=A0A673K3Q1_9TELE
MVILSLFVLCQYKGQANLHVFEDWCGSSISQLRKNLHFPLYPHTRTTVKKIAVAPKWKNYGLRIFGFIHPYKDGDFQFAIASDDNAEMWLSSDESPLNAHLLVYVGQHGSEWTAPGEFSKFRSQTSKPVRLMSSRRYYFEVLHKQDDRGSDHVEVGWKPFLPGLKYDVIDSADISLYTDESSLKMNSVCHIPQTLASHSLALQVNHRTETHTADMLKPDPRDTYYKIPMIDQSRLGNVLPSCVYSPTYMVKDFPIARYQGLQFVYLSYVYPNDFTRLTHMEKKNKCFYRESPVYLEKFGFYKYMKMDEEEDDQPVFFPKPDGLCSAGILITDKNSAAENFPLMGLKNSTQSALLKHSHPSMPTEPGPHNKGDPTASISDPDSLPPSSSEKRDHPGLNSSENNQPLEVQLTNVSETPEGSDMAPQSRGLEEGEMSEYSYEEAEARPHLSEEAINWQRTFSVNPVDFELLRSDWNDLRCNVSGNLHLAENEVIDVISQYMERLNERNGGIYTLVRIVNVEKRRDSARGNRYLMELLLMEGGKRVVRLSDYIYLLLHRSRYEDGIESREGTLPSSHHTPSKNPPPSGSSIQTHTTTPWSTSWAKPLLCQPSMLEWRHDVMVHFVVPVKNQARWVQQFISDMELLHRETKDENFSVIIVDFQSDDMDVEQALKESTVPRYEYLRREGNFERSSGLQMGVDTIEDSHSIVFLCDLHIHFPHNILETIRKHCVEGRLAFAPIVMRLDCGSSPLEPDGFWEVNGFGLFGIYKSDFDKIGGMNTEEFKDRWGGEDWELLDSHL